jgi:ketosteroid isomerase-like protein
MSLENVELVRRALVAFAAASYDPRNVRGFFEYFEPDVEYDISRTNPETQLYFGREGVIAALEQWIGTWEGFEVEVVSLIDVGDDQVVSVIQERGKMRGSDVWVEHTRGAVWTIRDHRIARYEEHQDRAGALEAAAAGH